MNECVELSVFKFFILSRKILRCVAICPCVTKEEITRNTSLLTAKHYKIMRTTRRIIMLTFTAMRSTSIMGIQLFCPQLLLGPPTALTFIIELINN